MTLAFSVLVRLLAGGDDTKLGGFRKVDKLNMAQGVVWPSILGLLQPVPINNRN